MSTRRRVSCRTALPESTRESTSKRGDADRHPLCVQPREVPPTAAFAHALASRCQSSVGTRGLHRSRPGLPAHDRGASASPLAAGAYARPRRHTAMVYHPVCPAPLVCQLTCDAEVCRSHSPSHRRVCP
eukprot:scaffold314602_cov30-Tisochrysis_lutea.AAC.1